MKYWLITVSAPYCGTDTNYIAISEENPEDDLQEWFYGEAVEDLWFNYSRFVDDDVREDIEDGMSEDEAWAKAREEWDYDCDMKVEEISEEEYINDWENYEVVYSEVQDKDSN